MIDIQYSSNLHLILELVLGKNNPVIYYLAAFYMILKCDDKQKQWQMQEG